VLFLGLALAGVLMLSVRNAQAARVQTMILATVNQDLGREVAERTKTEAHLRESEERFRQAFTFAGIGMALVGLDGRWLRVNLALCDLVGYSEKELLEKTFQDITHREDLDTDLNQVRALLAGEVTHFQ